LFGIQLAKQHNRSLKVAVQGPDFWHIPYTYIQLKNKCIHLSVNATTIFYISSIAFLKWYATSFLSVTYSSFHNNPLLPHILMLFTYVFPHQHDFNFWKEAVQNIEGFTTFQQALQLLSELMSVGGFWKHLYRLTVGSESQWSRGWMQK
jgi:hypothetical protein